VVAGREVVTRIAYNDKGQPTVVTESGYTPGLNSKDAAQPISRTTTYRYNSLGLRIETDGPLSNAKDHPGPDNSDITRVDYDLKTKLPLRVVAPGGILTEVTERDAALRPIAVRNTDGVRTIETRLTYNHAGHILTLTQRASFVKEGQGGTALQRNASFTYDAFDRLVSVTAPDRTTWRTEYDAAGRPVGLIDAKGNRIASRFDTEGKLVVVVAQDRQGEILNGMLNLWDGQGNLRARLKPDGLEQAQGTTAMPGELIRFDGDGAVSAAAVHGGQMELLAADRTTRHLVFGKAGMALTDGAGRIHGMIRDDFDRVVLEASPDEGRISFSYSDAGFEKRHTARDGEHSVVERLEFAPTGRLVKRIRAGCTETLRYEGDLLARLDGCGNSHAFKRDAFGQITAHEQSIEREEKAGNLKFVERYAYDATTGQLAERRLPDGQRLSYRYDADDGKVAAVYRDAGWLAWIDHRLGQGVAQAIRAVLPHAFTEQAILAEVSHRPFGGIATLVHGNGVRDQAQYDRTGRLTSLDIGTEQQPGAVEAVRYRYDAARNIAAVVHNQEERRYRYDGMHRLTGETGQVKGQRVAARVERPLAPAANDAFYSYDALGRRRGDVAERDGFGRQSGRGSQRLAYDDAHRLIEVTEGGKTVARYRYDALGNRIAKIVDGHTTYYLYDTAHRLVGEAGEDGQVRAQYLYAGTRPYAVLKAAGAGQARSLYAVHADQRGLPLAVTDEGRKVVWQGEFDAFGNVRKVESQEAANDRRFEMPLRMAGQYEDAETGLFYNVHRYYDPQRGHYLTPDPIGMGGGADSYAYVDSNPLAGVDPHGLFEIPVAAFVGENVLPVTDGGHGDIVHIAFRQYAEDVKEVRFSQTIIDQIILNNYHSDAATSVLLGTGGQFNFKNHFDNPNDGPMYTDASMSKLTEKYVSGTSDWIQKALDQINKNRSYYSTVTKTKTYQNDISLIISSFGQNSHALADFYSHTNWVDSPCRGGEVKNEGMWFGTETGYVPKGLGKTTIWDEDVSAKLYSGTVNLTGQPKSCLTSTDIGCTTDKTTHGYWNKDHDTLTPDEQEFTAAEQKKLAEQGLVYWEVRKYDPENLPMKYDSDLGKSVQMTYGTEWYGEYGKVKSDLKKGDRIYVQQPITNHHRLAMVLAVEHTKKEIDKLYDAAKGVSVGDLTLQKVFTLEKGELNNNNIKFDFYYPKNK
jgi:RHS repeat-associated protein